MWYGFWSIVLRTVRCLLDTIKQQLISSYVAVNDSIEDIFWGKISSSRASRRLLRWVGIVRQPAYCRHLKGIVENSQFGVGICRWLSIAVAGHQLDAGADFNCYRQCVNGSYLVVSTDDVQLYVWSMPMLNLCSMDIYVWNSPTRLLYRTKLSPGLALRMAMRQRAHE